MHNRFHNTLTDMKAQSAQSLMKQLYPRKHSSQHEQMAMQSFTRAQDWAKEQLLEEQTLKTYRDGTIPVIHPDLHGFRTREKTRERHDKDIYVKNYQPAKLRAETTRQDFRSTHLESTPYKSSSHFLGKTRILEKEMGPQMRYGIRTQNERLNEHLAGSNRLLDPSSKENTMLENPKWKEIEKDKWVAKNDFDLTTCYFRKKRVQDPWQMVSIGNEESDKYVDGFDVTGDISRRRNKQLEMTSQGFLATIRPNASTNKFSPPMFSNSIRMGKSANFFATSPNFHSKKSYPKTLAQVISNNDFDEDSPRSRSQSPKGKVIQIKAGSTLDPLKESVLFTGGITKEKFSTPLYTDKYGTKSVFGVKKGKNSMSKTREEHIKDTVKAYFD